MAAMLVMKPGLFEQSWVSASQGVFNWKLSLNPVVLEEKMFINADGVQDGQPMDEQTPKSLVY